MLIHFDGVDLQSSTGPNTFAGRLGRALVNAGHELTATGPEADVSLVFIQHTGAPLGRRVVQRLDGFWSRPDDFHTRNQRIVELYRNAHAVIWQSDFDRRMTMKWWGTPSSRNAPFPHPGTVINNGIELKPVAGITIPKLAEMRASYERIYACSANWHPQKRLQSNIDLFLHFHALNPSSCLIILGDHPDVTAAHPHIFYAGSTTPDVYMQVYSAADWFLHLAWGDHCPNTVIEALSQGTPIACSESGGTKELIGGYGVVMKEREPYRLELIDYDNPPSIDVAQLDGLPDRRELDYTTIANIDIDDVAARYIEVFNEVYTRIP